MKAEKYVLSFLGTGVLIWSITMGAGVVGLARMQGPPALLAWLEVAAFAFAGLVPVLVIWSPRFQRKALIGLWAVCITYVAMLALNLIRLDLVAKGTLRLTLWLIISVLFIRALRSGRKGLTSRRP